MRQHQTRMVGQNGQHLLRVDKELSYTKSTVEDELLKDLTDTDTVIISDYNKGVIKKDTVQKLNNEKIKQLEDKILEIHRPIDREER